MIIVRVSSQRVPGSKYAVTAFGEAFRKEVTQRHLRVSLVEPGAVETELPLQNRPDVRDRVYERYTAMECLRPTDVADTIAFIVTRRRHVAVNEILVRPTEQQEFWAGRRSVGSARVGAGHPRQGTRSALLSAGWTVRTSSVSTSGPGEHWSGRRTSVCSTTVLGGCRAFGATRWPCSPE